MAILVTGAAGFIGSHVAEALAGAGHQVVALDDLSGGFQANVPAGVQFHAGSVLDADLVGRLFQEYRFEHVFHLAAYAAEGLSHFIRRFNYLNNLVGSMNVLNEAIKARTRCFVFTSSIAVYGSSHERLNEELTPQPEDPYGIAKLAVEQDLKAAHEMFGLNYVIFRPHNVFGERQHIGDRYRNVIGIFMSQIMRGEPMTIFGDGTQSRAFTYIADVAPVLARSIATDAAFNQTFNVGADEPVTLNALAAEVAKAMGVAPTIRYLPPRKEVPHALADHGRLAEVFGYQPAWSLRDGLERMAKWARSIGPQAPSVFQDIEVRDQLPPHWTVTR